MKDKTNENNGDKTTFKINKSQINTLEINGSSKYIMGRPAGQSLAKTMAASIYNTVTKHEQCFVHYNGNSHPGLGVMVEKLTPPPQ